MHLCIPGLVTFTCVLLKNVDGLGGQEGMLQKQQKVHTKERIAMFSINIV
jgi:hypothetical protein